MEETTAILSNLQKDAKVNYISDMVNDLNCENKQKTSHYLFPGTTNKFTIQVDSIYPSVLSEIYDKLLQLVRTAENNIREGAGLPKVGEGWISETILYNRIKEFFQNEVVIHHGKPHWLGRQHFDVFFPHRNIAIEYQGDQHSRPIEYFGGDENYKMVVELDKRKQKLSKQNKCHLVYVEKDYDFTALIREIEAVIIGKKKN